MSDKVVLTYLNGRGKMESIRWLLAVAGVEFDEIFLTTRQQYLTLAHGGSLMFQQLPLVEIDDMKLIQSKAILNYIAEKYNLHSKDPKERVMINMFSEGLMDLMDLIMMLPFSVDGKLQAMYVQARAKKRYMPVFERVLSRSDYLVGGRLTLADVQLLECSLMLEENFPDVLSGFPNIKAFQERMKKIPAIEKFLLPGSKRKPKPDEVYVKTVKSIFKL
ncbi:glutathione S-transferase 3-like isoform X2 [Synchiropus splendidus]|nr:glutathione S-transferase 3-like isoform X2 [Synchiropus splendidus]